MLDDDIAIDRLDNIGLSGAGELAVTSVACVGCCGVEPDALRDETTGLDGVCCVDGWRIDCDAV